MTMPPSNDWRTIKVRAAAGEQRIEARPSPAFEDKNSEALRERDLAAIAASVVQRDRRLAARAIELARQVDALDKEIRAAGVDRQVYRQVAHGTRALTVAVRMLLHAE